MSGIPNRQKLRFALLFLWGVLVVTALFLFLFHREVIQHQLQDALSTSMLVAGFIYLLLGCVRGFTLIPSTWLVLAAIPFFPPVPLFLLTLAGILVSSTSIYFFSEWLQLEEILNRRHAQGISRLKSLLQRYGLPIIIGWSFFPLAPTDLICYVCGVLRTDLKKFMFGVGLGEGAICGLYIFFGDSALRWLSLKF